jgi:hypothetical protein
MTDKYGKIHTDGSRSGGQPLDDNIEAKALALVNEVSDERAIPRWTTFYRKENGFVEALCRAIERHEAYKQEVSDALWDYFRPYDSPLVFQRFIIPKPKPDPLVEVLKAMQAEPTTYVTTEVYANRINAALEALGFEIREKGQ